MIGGFRNRVTIQAESQTPDGQGGYALSWTDVATTWADISPISGKEMNQAQQLQGVVTHVIKMRHRTDVTARSRIKMGTRVFNVRVVENRAELDRMTYLRVEEGVAT